MAKKENPFNINEESSRESSEQPKIPLSELHAVHQSMEDECRYFEDISPYRMENSPSKQAEELRHSIDDVRVAIFVNKVKSIVPRHYSVAMSKVETISDDYVNFKIIENGAPVTDTSGYTINDKILQLLDRPEKELTSLEKSLSDNFLEVVEPVAEKVRTLINLYKSAESLFPSEHLKFTSEEKALIDQRENLEKTVEAINRKLKEARSTTLEKTYATELREICDSLGSLYGKKPPIETIESTLQERIAVIDVTEPSALKFDNELSSQEKTLLEAKNKLLAEEQRLKTKKQEKEKSFLRLFSLNTDSAALERDIASTIEALQKNDKDLHLTKRSLSAHRHDWNTLAKSRELCQHNLHVIEKLRAEFEPKHRQVLEALDSQLKDALTNLDAFVAQDKSKIDDIEVRSKASRILGVMKGELIRKAVYSLEEMLGKSLKRSLIYEETDPSVAQAIVDDLRY